MTSSDLQQRPRKLPGVDTLLKHSNAEPLLAVHSRTSVVAVLRELLDSVRHEMIAEGSVAPKAEDLLGEASLMFQNFLRPSLRRVLNATGILLHTNLGRAPLGESVLSELVDSLSGYTNLEYDLQNGRRGSRSTHISDLLRFLTGAEAAIAVNNNAAAVVLTLHTFAREREVVISRGELIEIGGSFRLPDIMAASSARMVEVGTTNRTRVSDYEEVLSDKTAMLLKAHPSNYEVQGFTECVSVKELADLAHSRGLPLVYDIGSGLLREEVSEALCGEPSVELALADGADLVTFSCDKLLGGPQGGIIAGKQALIEELLRAPLLRAFRLGKLSIAALSAVCRQYLREDVPGGRNPLFQFLNRSAEELRQLAEELLAQLRQKGVEGRVVESTGQCGGGSMPGRVIPSFAVALVPSESAVFAPDKFAEKVFHQIQQGDPAAIAVLRKGEIVFDVLTLLKEELPVLTALVAKAAAEQSI